jgi:hypothetical protein
MQMEHIERRIDQMPKILQPYDPKDHESAPNFGKICDKDDDRNMFSSISDGGSLKHDVPASEVCKNFFKSHGQSNKNA